MKKNKGRYVPALGRSSLTRLYDPVMALTMREGTFRGHLVRQAGIHPGVRLLDLGCGTGTLTISIAGSHPDAKVVGLDGDADVLSIAKQKAAGAGVEIRFDVGLSYDLPYPDASFDRVVSSLLFHHLTRSDKRRTIAEIHRVLKPGGQLHVADWGRPGSFLMKMLFYSVRLLDGFATTRDNAQGRLPDLLEEGGFVGVAVRRELSTIFGTLALLSADKAGLGRPRTQRES